MAKAVFCWGEDEDLYVYPGDDGLEEHRFTVEVPAALLAAVDTALNQYRIAVGAVAKAAGVDRTDMKMVECCPSWTGVITPPHRSFMVQLAGSGREDVWPRGDHIAGLGHFKTRQEAEDAIAGLPERFHVHYGAFPVAEVDKSRLSVGESGYRGSTSSCYRCGWERDEHADPGQEIERHNPFRTGGGEVEHGN